jgi:hypothetical protein
MRRFIVAGNEQFNQIDINHLIVGWASFVLAAFMGVVYYLTRLGFENPIWPVISSVSVAAILCFAPVFLTAYTYQKKAAPWHKGILAMLLYMLTVCFLLGVFTHYVGIHLFPLVVLLGSICLMLGIWHLIRGTRLLHIILFTVGGIIVGAMLFRGLFLDIHSHPLFVESTPVGGLFVSDTAFHTSLANMLLLHGRISTGLDGVIGDEYYVASHVMMYFYASLVGSRPISGWLLLYPVVFVPVFFLVMGWAGLTLRTILKPELAKRSITGDVLFWAVLLFGISMGVGDTYRWLHFIGESYMFSIFFAVMTVGILASFIYHYSHREGYEKTAEGVTFLVAGLPILLFLTGTAKLPALLVLFTVLVYLFARHLLFLKWPFIVGFVVSALATVAAVDIALFVNAADERSGLELFHFFKCCAPGPSLAIVFYLTSILFVILYVMLRLAHLKPRSWRHFIVAVRSNRLFVAGTLLVLMVVSLGPGQIVMIGLNQIYFMGMQKWIAMCVLMAVMPALLNFERTEGIVRSVAYGLSAMVLVGVVSSAVVYTQGYLERTVRIRAAYIAEPLPEGLLPRMNHVYQQPVDISRQPVMLLYEELMELSTLPVEQRRQSAVYVPKSVKLFWSTGIRQCFGDSMMAPALSEMAMIYGLPTEECRPSVYGYKFRFYPDPIYTPLGTPARPTTELCQRAQDMGFSEIWMLTLNDQQRPETTHIVCEPDA